MESSSIKTLKFLIKENFAFTQLNLTNNIDHMQSKITPKGAKMLAEALKYNKILTVLYLGILQ